MTILLHDPRVSAVPVEDHGEPLVALTGAAFDVSSLVLVRRGVATRLARAAAQLPMGLRLRVVEGLRSATAQQRIIDDYSAALRLEHPTACEDEIARLSSRFVAPLAVAPHVAGAAVDLTLVDQVGRPLDLGTEIDATPEQSDGACFFDSPAISARARAHRVLLAQVLGEAGMVNYPTEWWHWSYGDRYWALVTGAPAALYGPVDLSVAV